VTSATPQLRAGAAIAAARPEPPLAADPVALVELRNGPLELTRLLLERLAHGDALNAFLFAAGLEQIVEDRLEADPLRLADVRRLLAGAGRERAARAAGRADAAVARGRGFPPGLRRLRTLATALAPIVDSLADAAVAGRPADRDLRALDPTARDVCRGLGRSRALAGETVRLPSCFRAFDQHPEDIERLVSRIAAESPDRERPLAVVGIRTSGSYLGPLTAAFLRAEGYRRVDALTARPWRPLGTAKRRRLEAVVREGGLVIVTDDPPASGETLAQVAAAIEALGAPRDSIVLLFATGAGASGAPAAVRDRPCVTLPWEQWSVHDRLAPAAIADGLERLWPGTRVTDVTPRPLADDPARGHGSARYTALVDSGRGPTVRQLLVRGVGIGYFGHHSLAIARELGERVPAVHGVIDGLLVREWLPQERRLDGAAAGAAPSARGVAAYAALRRSRLRVTADRADRMAGEDPVWEVASNVLSRGFGRGWRPMRLAAVDRAVRELLRARHPSVVDGWMTPSSWFRGADADSPVKIKPDERAFSNRNLACYDAAFDVAAAASWERGDGHALRVEFARATGEWIDDERWLLYQLVAHWAARRDGLLEQAEADRASARALARYFAGVYLDDLPRSSSGPLCAIDLDGVLETEALGFPGTSPAGALALRALLAHGYRPLVASGRSIGEVAERCRAYGLAGGVAEYGAAVYRAASDVAEPQVSADDQAAVERARGTLDEAPGVRVGAYHRHVVRASGVDARGRLGPLGPGSLRAALTAAGDGLRPVPGEGQTDLVPAAVDKAKGLRALLASLACDPDGRPLALAVGDAAEDLPMMALAALGRAPANADRAMRRSGTRRVALGYQAGLSLAVRELIGHAPGACPRCRVAPLPSRTRLLLALLGAPEAGGARLGLRALQMPLLVRRPRAAG
jgi:hydroxymethylpyrimidine pyrophosphatase-like HAD family hydrolase